jgi:hypothetical protein
MADIILVSWHWLVLGMLLIIAELFIPSFTIFWFGLGALLVAGCLWLLPGSAGSSSSGPWPPRSSPSSGFASSRE